MLPAHYRTAGVSTATRPATHVEGYEHQTEQPQNVTGWFTPWRCSHTKTKLRTCTMHLSRGSLIHIRTPAPWSLLRDTYRFRNTRH